MRKKKRIDTGEKYMRKDNRLIYIGFILVLVITVGLSILRYDMLHTQDVESDVVASTEVRKEQASSADMKEDLSVYDQDDPDSVVCFYVTVMRGDAGSDTDHSFAEVNNVVRFVDDSHFSDDVYARALVQVGDESGPCMGMLGYGATQSNARIRVRGNSSSVNVQKSYKLDLDEEAGLWRGQSNIALNKSAFDVTRIKNKMYFDLLKTVPEVPSIRTQFVHLYIRDETSGSEVYQDYGFYTQAEVPSRKYLANHGFDKNGYLYKAISFNFERSDVLKTIDDPSYDQAAFETVLSCKGRQDHSKILNLIDLINDRSMDINDIIGTYIDRDNYITWLAYNILMANVDTTVQNFYLYSPLNSKKWYFIPWDGDNMLHVKEDEMEGLSENYGKYEHGISNYWGVILHQRFLKIDTNRKQLEEKVDELYRTINPESVQAMVDAYNRTVEPYVLSNPDFYYLGHTFQEREQILSGLGQEVGDSYLAFKASLHELMPMFEAAQDHGNGNVTLSWTEAYDFDNEDITYHVTVADDPGMRNPVIDTFHTLTQMDLQLPSGTYYLRVTASSTSGKTAEAMDKINVNGVYYPGVIRFEVN